MFIITRLAQIRNLIAYLCKTTDQLFDENTLALVLNIIIIRALLSGRMSGLRSLFRSRLGNVEIEFDD